ncbi:hypothetical protein AB0K09_23605, partial [Streptomyces sp. NPDC049577]
PGQGPRMPGNPGSEPSAPAPGATAVPGQVPRTPEGMDPESPVSEPGAAAGVNVPAPLRPSAPAPGVPDRRVQTEAADASPYAHRFLTAVAALLGEDPYGAQPVICRWFDDDRPLQTAPGAGYVLTVATVAQVLLHTHRRRAIDDLAEALVDAAHPRADELLAALAEDEPSALCRAVDRWAHDERVERHVAAAAYALKTARHVTTDADRELLRYSALALLARPAETSLHGTALALLVRDPVTRAKHLPQALDRFAEDDPQLPPAVLLPALTTHPGLVLDAFRARLYEPGERPGAVLRALAEVSSPELARRVATLVREHVRHRPEGAQNAAEFVERRLEEGPAARAVLHPLVADLLRTFPAHVRRALAPVLAAPGTPVSRPLRQELLEVLLEQEEYGPYERDLTVLEALLRAAAEGAAERMEARTRDLVHRTGLLMSRTPEGAACFDRRLTALARDFPVFGAQVRGWLLSAPSLWAVVVGPSARIRLTAGMPSSDASTPATSSAGPEPGSGAASGADLTVRGPADAGRREPAWHS